jgi:hypothetical protein
MSIFLKMAAINFPRFLVPKFHLGMTAAKLSKAGRFADLNEFPSRVWELETEFVGWVERERNEVAERSTHLMRCSSAFRFISR